MIEKAKNKLLDEKKDALSAAGNKNAGAQFDMVYEELFELLEQDVILCENILKEHKSFARCYKYMEKKARDMAEKGAHSFCVSSHVLFDWLREYYALDDEAAVRKEKEKEEEEKKKREALKALQQTSTVSKTDNVQTPVKKKSKKKENPDQLSLFDMFG